MIPRLRVGRNRSGRGTAQLKRVGRPSSEALDRKIAHNSDAHPLGRVSLLGAPFHGPGLCHLLQRLGKPPRCGLHSEATTDLRDRAPFVVEAFCNGVVAQG